MFLVKKVQNFKTNRLLFNALEITGNFSLNLFYKYKKYVWITIISKNIFK